MTRRAPLRRTPIRPKPRRPKAGDDPEYLRWIREQPCLVCRAWPVEAAHLHSGRQGVGLKSPDRFAVPLCPAHHRTGPAAHHRLGSDALFGERHGLDLPESLDRLREQYELFAA